MKFENVRLFKFALAVKDGVHLFCNQRARFARNAYVYFVDTRARDFRRVVKSLRYYSGQVFAVDPVAEHKARVRNRRLSGDAQSVVRAFRPDENGYFFRSEIKNYAVCNHFFS